MPRPIPDPRDATPGYTLLLWVDQLSGRHNGSETVLVPLAIGETLNAARRVLYHQSEKAGAWERACVVREVLPVHDEDEVDSDPPESLARQANLEQTATSSAVTATPTAEPTPAQPARTKRARAAAGHAVRVISAAAIGERRKSIEERSKFSTAEKKTELKFVDDLLERGETRIVSLKADWRIRIAQMRVDMPNLAKVVDRLEACCALSAFARKPLRIPPLLLVGPPGVGKTTFANRVADLLGTKSFVYALESARSAASA